MQSLLLSILLLSLVLLFAQPLNASKTFWSNPANQGSKACLVCVAVVDLAEKAAEDRREELAKIMAHGCDKIFPGGSTARDICTEIVTDYGGDIIDLLLKKELPDAVCSKVGLCKECRLFPKEKLAKFNLSDKDVHEKQYKARFLAAVLDFQLKSLGFVDEPTYDKGESNGKNYKPSRLADIDGDGFAWNHKFPRAADWRGKDCNDVSSDSQPGRKEETGNYFDKNCNGISGKTHTVTGDSYEDLYCNSFKDDRQLISFGDSANAAFTIPVEWLSFKDLKSVVGAIINELDWPMRSYSTGYKEKESLVTKLFERNRCSHRQYQNIGMNGAVMADLADQVGQAEINKHSKPVFATIGYIGNDICKPSLDQMTRPEDFRKQLVEGLHKLDQKLPANSRVTLLGLVDGSIIYENVANVTHPLSIHEGDLTVADFYRFLSCAGANPCQTWLTDDSSSREAATRHAKKLDSVIQDVIQNSTFSNFEAAFVDFADIIKLGFEKMDREGIPHYKMMDPVDNFHPSLDVGHRLIADAVWTLLEKQHPGFIGELNPNNDAIKKRFGDQGGF